MVAWAAPKTMIASASRRRVRSSRATSTRTSGSSTLNNISANLRRVLVVGCALPRPATKLKIMNPAKITESAPAGTKRKSRRRPVIH